MWTYDPTDLDTSTSSGRLNVVRFLVGDTDTLDQQVKDEEVTFALSTTGDDVYMAASFLAKAIASKYARLVSTELDGQLRSDYSDRYKAYKSLSSELKDQGKTFGAKIGVAGGGLTFIGVFSRGQFDNVVEEE